jgi:hypothetical protein
MATMLDSRGIRMFDYFRAAVPGVADATTSTKTALKARDASRFWAIVPRKEREARASESGRKALAMAVTSCEVGSVAWRV